MQLIGFIVLFFSFLIVRHLAMKAPTGPAATAGLYATSALITPIVCLAILFVIGANNYGPVPNEYVELMTGSVAASLFGVFLGPVLVSVTRGKRKIADLSR